MRWDSIILLRDVVTNSYVDAEGNDCEGEPIDTQAFCNVRHIDISTWSTAAATGPKPELQVEVRSIDYAGQTQAVFEGGEYDLMQAMDYGENVKLVYSTHVRNDNG